MSDPVSDLIDAVEEIFVDIFPDQQPKIRKALDRVKAQRAHVGDEDAPVLRMTLAEE